MLARQCEDQLSRDSCRVTSHYFIAVAQDNQHTQTLPYVHVFVPSVGDNALQPNTPLYTSQTLNRVFKNGHGTEGTAKYFLKTVTHKYPETCFHGPSRGSAVRCLSWNTGWVIHSVFPELVLLLCDLQCKDSMGARLQVPGAPFNAGHLNKYPVPLFPVDPRSWTQKVSFHSFCTVSQFYRYVDLLFKKRFRSTPLSLQPPAG